MNMTNIISQTELNLFDDCMIFQTSIFLTSDVEETRSIDDGKTVAFIRTFIGSKEIFRSCCSSFGVNG